jgi:hypothetical protein
LIFIELINQIEELQAEYEAIRQKSNYRRKEYDLSETSREIQKLKELVCVAV